MVRVRARGARWLRHDRMGRRAALVYRRGRHDGDVEHGGDPERGRHAQSAAPRGDVRYRGTVELLSLLDAPQWRARTALPDLRVPHGGDEAGGPRESWSATCAAGGT